MPSTQELLFLVAAVFVLWVVLKLAKLAVKVILFLITIGIIAGVLWLVLVR